jgi:GMP synthase-like glutamine amidotransferase
MDNTKIQAPFHVALRNSIIILIIAGIRSGIMIVKDGKPFQWSPEYLQIILIWAVSILGICFGHAYLGSKIGRISAGVIVGLIAAVIIGITFTKIIS